MRMRVWLPLLCALLAIDGAGSIRCVSGAVAVRASLGRGHTFALAQRIPFAALCADLPIPLAGVTVSTARTEDRHAAIIARPAAARRTTSTPPLPRVTKQKEPA